MDLLRFATAGSVDDGKSTLIGRLLLDSKAIFEDQLEAVEATSQSKGYDYTDLALLTDGLPLGARAGHHHRCGLPLLRDPAAQVHHRRHPGPHPHHRDIGDRHLDSDLGLVLVDARQGLTEQSRSKFIQSSCRCCECPTWCWPSTRWTSSTTTDPSTTRSPGVHLLRDQAEHSDLEVIPISALNGDNVVNRSENMPWYNGSSLMHHLENVHVASDRDLVDPRLPVQYVVRPKSDQFHDYRGYAGQVAGGCSSRATRSSYCPAAYEQHRGIDLFDRRSTRPSRPCRSPCASPTTSTSAAVT